MKKCRKCGETKPQKAFYRDKRRKDGRRCYCEKCESIARELSAGSIQQYNQAYYHRNREKLAQRSSEHYQANKEERQAYTREYYKKRRAEARERDILVRARSRARRHGILFDLGIEDILIPDVCPVLGIPIDCLPKDKRGATQNSPSIDRMDPTKGYVRGNVRVVSHRANTLKNNATLEELELVIQDLRRIREEGREIWRDVADFSGCYQVSDHGRVRSLERVVNRGKGTQRVRERFLRPGKNKSGYAIVVLSRAGKQHVAYVHRLVLTAFVGPAPEGHEGKQKNGVRHDCRLSNLFWGLQQDRGTQRHPESRCSGAKLTPSAVRKIRTRYAAREPVSQIGHVFGVSPRTVYHLLQGRTWSHVK